MLLDWLHGDLHHWTIFCCTVASLGLVGAFWVALAAAGGKGVFAFLNGSRQPTVIVVNGGQYVQQPQKRTWGFGRLWLLFAAIFSGGPMVTLGLLWANHAAEVAVSWVAANWWLIPVVGVGVLLCVVFGLLIKRERQVENGRVAELNALPSVAAVEPVALWSAPEVEGNWAERS